MKYIEQALPALNDKFEEIYLLKNIRHFTLYTFEEGRSFQPDFLLHLKENIDNEPLIYHVFIELNKAQSSNNDSKIKE